MVRHKPKLKAPAGFQSASTFFMPVKAKTDEEKAADRAAAEARTLLLQGARTISLQRHEVEHSAAQWQALQKQMALQTNALAIASLRGRSRQRAHGLAAPFPTLAEHSRGLCERCVPAESRRGGFAPHSPPCTLTVLCLLPNPSGRSLCVT
jgi:hypothetical protein